VRRAHAHLERAERMLDDFVPRAHRIRVEVEALLHRFENVFVLPSRDPTLRPVVHFDLSAHSPQAVVQ
jgi:hypothetical protein